MKAKPKKKPVKESNKERYEREILEVIQKNGLITVIDIFAFYSGCCRDTFYNNNLDKSDTIKRALDDNKTKMSQSLLLKWLKSDNATLQLAAYKIICTDENRKKLSMNYTDVTSNGQSVVTNPTLNITCIKVDVGLSLTEEEIEERLKIEEAKKQIEGK